MKKTAIVLAASLSALISCGTPGEDPTITTKYRIIKNNSSHLVDLTILGSKQYQLQLDMGDSVVFTGYYENGAGASYSEIGWNGLEPISGRIVFDSEREIIYDNGSCDKGRNPLNPVLWELHDCGYYDRFVNGKNEYVYIIDDSDYEMAVAIGD